MAALFNIFADINPAAAIGTGTLAARFAISAIRRGILCLKCRRRQMAFPQHYGGATPHFPLAPFRGSAHGAHVAAPPLRETAALSPPPPKSPASRPLPSASVLATAISRLPRAPVAAAYRAPPSEFVLSRAPRTGLPDSARGPQTDAPDVPRQTRRYPPSAVPA